MLSKNVLMHEDMILPKPLSASPRLPLYFVTHFPAWGLEALRRDGQGQREGLWLLGSALHLPRP